LIDQQLIHTLMMDGSFSYGALKTRGWREEAVLLVQSSLKPCYKPEDLLVDSTLYTLPGSAPGNLILLPPINIPQAPLPLCSHPYSGPTRLLSHRDARPLAGRPAPLGCAPGSREEGCHAERLLHPN